MKHTLIETEKASVLVVDADPGFTLSGNRLEWPASRPVKIAGESISRQKIYLLPPGPWISAGPLKDVKEDVAALMVEKDNRGYKYHWKDSGFVPRGFNARFETATESLYSLVAANMKLENKYGKEPPVTIFTEAGNKSPHFWNEVKEHQEKNMIWKLEEETVYRNPVLFYFLKEKK